MVISFRQSCCFIYTLPDLIKDCGLFFPNYLSKTHVVPSFLRTSALKKRYQFGISSEHNLNKNALPGLTTCTRRKFLIFLTLPINRRDRMDWGTQIRPIKIEYTNSSGLPVLPISEMKQKHIPIILKTINHFSISISPRKCLKKIDADSGLSETKNRITISTKPR